ncbi:MAG: glycoside hydrolase family 3 C-terminal domain-containing protein, partial [Anaerolineales bacterium]
MTLTIEKRLNSLLSQMTIEEKVSQMVYDAPAVERLGIPKYNWWNECLHGLGRAGVATVFPQTIGLAATWNPDLMHQVATAISDEARAKHHQAVRLGIREIYSGLTFWSPNINIFRDPRWGRGQETYGEDPYLTSVMGITFIKGLQGNHPEYLKLVATPKHFAVHSGPESDRHHFDARVGERDLRETYLPAFEACVKEAQAASIMGAYNRINGEPCCASRTLLEKILKDEWGFEGFVVSDCGAILDIYAHHQVVDTAAQASSLAVKNGCDLNCGNVYPALLEAVEQGLISEEIITQAVERLFRARFRLGMFDPEETVPYTGIPYDVVDSKEHRELALEAARQSIVLLKNEDGLLPLSKDIHSIAVIGPNADDVGSLLGNYNGTPREPITPLKGIRNILPPEAKVYYAQGCEIAADVLPMNPIPPAYLRPDKVAGDTEGLKAAYYQSTNFAGEPSVVCVDPCVDFIWKDTTPLSGKWGHPFAVRWSGYLVPPESGIYRLGVNGFNQYRLYLDGSCIVEYDDIHHPVLKSKDVHLEAEHAYPIRLDYVNIGLDPQVRLLWSMPRRDYQTEALNIARQAEVLVLVMGLSPALEGEEMPVQVQGFTGGDRTDISLPRPQLELLKSMHALGKPVILVLQNGSALAVGWADQNIPAILEAWYPGQAGGQALAEVIFGDFNPSGRLPLTFYKALEDLPPFENYDMAGRTYRYFEGQPLYPFGHGLSYTTFSYSDLQIRPAQIKAGAQVTVRCDVTNTGDRAGDEVVQLYLRHRGVPDPAPIKELKCFGHISLEPGESKTVEFTLGAAQLRSYVEAEGWHVHPGVVDVMVGRSSIDLPLNGQFEVMGTSTL